MLLNLEIGELNNTDIGDVYFQLGVYIEPEAFKLGPEVTLTWPSRVTQGS
jgi:hypothetical protein